MKRTVLAGALIALLIIVAVVVTLQARQVVAKEKFEPAALLAPLTTFLPVRLGKAQQPTFKRTVLQRGDLSIPGREAVQAIAEIPSGLASGRHTHPGEEVGYILAGTVVMEIEGKPPLTLKPGDVFLIPAGRIHNARSIGTETAKALSTYVVEKGKALATPVP